MAVLFVDELELNRSTTCLAFVIFEMISESKLELYFVGVIISILVSFKPILRFSLLLVSVFDCSGIGERS